MDQWLYGSRLLCVNRLLLPTTGTEDGRVFYSQLGALMLFRLISEVGVYRSDGWDNAEVDLAAADLGYYPYGSVQEIDFSHRCHTEKAVFN